MHPAALKKEKDSPFPTGSPFFFEYTLYYTAEVFILVFIEPLVVFCAVYLL